MKRFPSVFWWDFVILGVIAIAHYLQVRIYVGPVEDMIYKYVSSPDGPLFDYPIHSLYDAFISQCNDYFYVNGRFLNHVIIQYLCGMTWGREVFLALDSLFFAGVIFGMVVLIRDYCKKTFADIWVVLLSLLWLSPHQGLTLLGHIAFGVNYIWGGFWCIWFLILWKYCQFNAIHRNVRPVIVAASLVVGSLHEGYSIPISAGLLVYYLVNHKRLHSFEACLAVAFCIGACFVTFAPANFVRLSSLTVAREEESISLVFKSLRMAKNLVFGSKAVDLFVILVFLCAIPKYRAFVEKHIVEIMVPSSVMAFAMFVAWADVHQLMPLVLFSIILVCSFIYKQLRISYVSYGLVFSLVIFISLIPGYVEVYRVRSLLKERWECFFEQSKNSDSDYCNAKDILSFCRDVNSSYTGYTDIGYCMMQMTGGENLEKITLAECNNGHSIRKTAVLPDTKEILIQGCKRENAINDSIYVFGGLRVKAMPSNGDSTEPYSFVCDNVRYTVLY